VPDLRPHAALAVAGAALIAALSLLASGWARADTGGRPRTDEQTRVSAFSAQPEEGGEEATADFAITPLVTPRIREFVESSSDFERSSLLGRILTPLLVLLLVEREILAAAGRPGGRVFVACGLALVTAFLMLVLVRIREYLG